MTYRIFRRAWWRREGGKLVPNSGGRKTTLAHVDTIEEARAYCARWNAERDAQGRNPLSIAAEFEATK